MKSRPRVVPSTIQKLIMLEELHNQIGFSREINDRLVDIYAQLVEHFDHKEDPTKLYFLEKMQNSITKRPGSEGSSSFMRKAHSLSLSESLPELLLKMEQRPSEIFQKRSMQRVFDFKLHATISESSADPRLDISSRLKAHDSLAAGLDSIVRTQLVAQERSLCSRLGERRLRSASKAKQDTSTTQIASDEYSLGQGNQTSC